MKKGRDRIRELSRWLGVSPRQAACLLVGIIAIVVWCVAAIGEVSMLRDIGGAVVALVLLTFPVMLLKALNQKTSSIRRDIQKQGHAHAASARRVESVLGTGSSSRSNAGTIGNSVARSGDYFGVGPQYEYAERALLNLGSYETFALRTKSLKMRDVLARSASGLQFDYADLMRLIRTSGLTGVKKHASLYQAWNKDALCALARVAANQRLCPDDAATAMLIFQFCETVFGAKALGRTDRKIYLECLSDAGLSKKAEKKLREYGFLNNQPLQSALIRANMANAGRGQLSETWISLVNEVLAVDGLLPISINSGEGPALDRISCVKPATRRVRNRPLISVVVPTHNGASLIGTALRSLKEQTWSEIEVIVVDDGSKPAEVRKLRDVCSQYEQVILLEQKENHGAYAARNAALRVAKGEFVTVHDDDDWSHPEKLERQARALIKNPDVPANMSLHSRATDDLKFVRVNINLDFVQPNYSSIMVRRSTLEEIGGWDLVNRGADAEFRDRINARFETKVEVIGRSPMSFTRTRAGSLTHGELDRGYIEPARLMYQQAYMQAHAEGSTVSTGARDFVAPLDMHPGMRGKSKGRFDVVYATDFRFPGGTTSLALAEIKAALESGLRVGVLQMDSPLNKPGTGYSSALLALFLERDVSLLRLGDEYEADLLIVRHPSVAQFIDTRRSVASIAACVLIVNTAPVLATGKGAVYDLYECSENIERCFGVKPVIVPESGVTRKLIERVGGASGLADFEWPGFVKTGRTYEGRTPGPGRPVVGRHSRDSRLKWPDSVDDFLKAYDQKEAYETHILGGMDSMATALSEATKSRIRVTPFGGTDVQEYLQSIDFWVYFHSESTIESFGMAAAEAMAAGLVVILPEYMSSTFGEAAVYAKPSEVKQIVAEYWRDPSKYENQSAKARRYVDETYSSSSYVDRLRKLLDKPAIPER